MGIAFEKAYNDDIRGRDPLSIYQWLCGINCKRKSNKVKLLTSHHISLDLSLAPSSYILHLVWYVMYGFNHECWEINQSKNPGVLPFLWTLLIRQRMIHMLIHMWGFATMWIIWILNSLPFIFSDEYCPLNTVLGGKN